MRITVGELIERLSIFDSDAVVIFGDKALKFGRLKSRGPDPETGERLCQLEFAELVYRDESGEVVVVDAD